MYPSQKIQRSAPQLIHESQRDGDQDDARQHNDAPGEIEGSSTHSERWDDTPNELDRRIGHRVYELGKNQPDTAGTPLSSEHACKIQDEPCPHQHEEDRQPDIDDRGDYGDE